MDIFISWDTGNKTGEHNAYSACCVFAFTRSGKFYLLEVIRGKYEMPQLIDKMVEVYSYWKYTENAGNLVKMLIEDKASGTQALQILGQSRDSRGFPFNIEAINPNDDKISRLKGANVYIEMGHVLFPKKEEQWWRDFKKELLGFPETKYKDQVDAFTQAITYFQKQP